MKLKWRTLLASILFWTLPALAQQGPVLFVGLMSLPTNQPGGATFFPGAAEFQSLIVNGIKSAMGLTPFCTK